MRRSSAPAGVDGLAGAAHGDRDRPGDVVDPAQRCRVDDEHGVQAGETDAALLLQPRVDRPPQDRLEPHQVIEYLPQVSHLASRPRPPGTI
jgi:hypothetical protein